jgi:hypothetical protein
VAVLLDLNNPVFQRAWFALEKDEKLAVLKTLEKMVQLEWLEVYRDKGLRWEAIQSRTGPNGGRIYSLRMTKKMRAVAFRDGEILRLLDLYADHDGSYE